MYSVYLHKNNRMIKKTITTPFPTTTYNGPEYFGDRVKETNTIISNIENQQSTTLIAIRRIGKTGLLNHLRNKINKDWLCIYVDILYTSSANDFLNILSTAILRSVSENSSIGKKIWNFFKSIQLNISYDALSGEPSVNFKMHKKESKTHLKHLFEMPILQQHGISTFKKN